MARPIPRPEPVIRATRSRSSIEKTRIAGKEASQAAGNSLGVGALLAGQQLAFGSGVIPAVRVYYGLTVFSWAAFYVFAKLVKRTLASRSLLNPAAEFEIEDCAHAANPILIFSHNHSHCVFVRGVWRLLQRWSRKWERAGCCLCHYATCESNCNRRPDRHLQRCRHGHSSAHLPMAKERCRYYRRDSGELYDAGHHYCR